MKNHNMLERFAMLACACLFSLPLAATEWTVDGTTIKKDGWVLNFSYANTERTEITVTGIGTGNVTPENGVLDLTGGVNDGSSIVGIGDGAFTYQHGVKEVVLPSGLRRIGDQAFSVCYDLQKVEPFLPDSLEYVGWSAFNSCQKLAGELVFHPSENFAWGAFNDGGSYAFELTAITSATLGENVTKIPMKTFNSCSAMATVVLSAKSEAIGDFAFGSCTALQTVYFPGVLPKSWHENAFCYVPQDQVKIYASKLQNELRNLAGTPPYEALTDQDMLRDGYASATEGEKPVCVVVLGYQRYFLHAWDSPLDSEAQSGTITVRSEPAGLGTATAGNGAYDGYARHVGVPAGTTFKVGRYAVKDGFAYRATGFVVEYQNPDTGDWLPFGENSGVGTECEWHYETQVDKDVRLTWRFDVAGCGVLLGGGADLVTIATGSEAFYEADGISYYAFGTQLTLTAAATDDLDVPFSGWSGDSDAKTSAIVVSVPDKDMADKPLMLVPLYGWRYDSGNNILTNSTTGASFRTAVKDSTRRELALTGKATSGLTGCHDYSLPIQDGDKNPWRITHYGERVFQLDMTVKQIVFSADAIEIGDFFCSDAAALERVVMDCPNLAAIGSYAFYGCASLTTVTPFLPSALKSIGVQAFFCSRKLTGDLVIHAAKEPFSWTGVGSGAQAFQETGIGSVDLGPGVTDLPYMAFNTCESMTNVVLRATDVSLNQYAFAYLSSLSNFYVSGRLTWQGNSFEATRNKRFFVPKGEAGNWWTEFLTAERMTPWAEVPDQSLYTSRYADGQTPIGLTTAAANLGGEQWICRWRVPGTNRGFKLIVR